MFTVLGSSVVDQGFSSGLINPRQIGICCFSGQHAVSRSKNKDVLARFQDNVSECSYMSSRGFFLVDVQPESNHLTKVIELSFHG